MTLKLLSSSHSLCTQYSYEIYYSPHSRVQINLIAPPSYVVITHTLDRAEGIERLKAALEAIKKSIEGSDGNFIITMQVCCRFMRIGWMLVLGQQRWELLHNFGNSLEHFSVVKGDVNFMK